jgi:hypothetical protein
VNWSLVNVPLTSRVPRNGEGHIVGTAGQPPREIALGERGVQIPEAVLAWMTHRASLDSPNRGPSLAQYCSGVTVTPFLSNADEATECEPQRSSLGGVAKSLTGPDLPG